ncbi:MAG: DUF92 domain-containing protein [Anaerolineales bacterium]
MTSVLMGLALAAAAAFAARFLGLLTTGGALAAAGIGTAIFAGGGWGLALTLIAAFALTGAATRYRRGEKIHPEHRRGRSAVQVLANGVIPAGLAVVGAAFDLPWALAGAAGAIAASTADTLATELGLLSATPPRLITTGERVPRGRSGGMTGIGTISGVGGALFVGAVFALGRGWAAVAAGGIGGMVIDSLLGATVQARYRCPACGEEGETKECGCGGTRMLAGGISWMTNDAVNLLMAAAGAAVSALLVS